mgnify:FL=1
MATNDEVHRELFAKVGTLANSVSELSGAVAVLNKTNTDLVALLKKALSYQFYVILLLIAVLIYGAIGEKGFRTVREAVPFPYNSDDQQTSFIAPWNDRKIVPIENQKS